VIISDDTIGAPIVSQPDIAVVLNRPSFDKYEPLVKKGGLLVVNNSLVSVTSGRTDIDTIYIQANAIAEELGTAKMLNMVVVGALLAARPILPLEIVEAALVNHLPASKKHLTEANLQVIRRGYEAGLPVNN
jgi:2-oxoglutarate ferredoxin oxidoreductase subunit gamma